MGQQGSGAASAARPSGSSFEAAPDASAEAAAERKAQEEAWKRLRELDGEQLLSAEETFHAAYADEKDALEQISGIVKELEEYGKDTAPQHRGARQSAKEKAAAKEKLAARQARVAACRAEDKADQWLQKQLRQQAAKPPAVRPQSEHAKSDTYKSEDAATDRRPSSSSRGVMTPKGGLSAATAAKDSDVAVGAKDDVSGCLATRLSRCELQDSSRLSPPAATLEEGRWIAISVIEARLSRLAPPQALREPSEEDPSPPEPPQLPASEVSLPVPELYKLLGVGVDATFAEIKRGYHRQALKWHPDKNRGREQQALERFKRINEAFDTLFDPEKRSSYDSGQIKLPSKAKKLQGHGWSKVSDEDDATLTPMGAKYKKQSWAQHVYFGGRIDDEEHIDDERDPRAPLEKVRVFWRFIGEKAYEAREARDAAESRHWLESFVASIWKDTPSRWPAAAELQGMNNVSQQEWKERRMVLNRRKQKVLVHVEMHEAYLELPNRAEREKARLEKIWPGRIQQ